MNDKEVNLKDAKYIVFVDFVESDARGYATLEDAEQELIDLETADGYGGTFNHYLVEVIKVKKINHG